ncbi:MAG: prepilin-type N-terminal cleavage/methylation domain-containing protein [Myxococcales bacterium]|nr:prepilin-type N-terminal cleavage/methylation domain-containing protein [Myxococcales bacterium]
MSHPRPRGFTLIEMMVTVAILGILVGLAAFALGAATRSAKLSGARFDVVNFLGQARATAVSRGHDVYVVFTNLESTTTFDSSLADALKTSVAPRVIVYGDPTLALRGQTNAQILAAIAAGPSDVIDQVSGGGVTYGSSGLTFIDRNSTVVPDCNNISTLKPPYLQVSGARLSNASRACSKAWCTFCTTDGSCTGTIRFSGDGTARVVNSPNAGSGGVVQLVDPDKATDRRYCILISEPAGLAMAMGAR